MFNRCLGKALVVRKVALSSRIFMWYYASNGDQQFFAVKFRQLAPYTALFTLKLCIGVELVH